MSYDDLLAASAVAMCALADITIVVVALDLQYFCCSGAMYTA